jgi:hypothetical protein
MFGFKVTVGGTVVVGVVVAFVVVVVVDSGLMLGFKVVVGGTTDVFGVEIVDNVVGVIAVSVPSELAHGGLTAELTTSDDTCGSSR